MPRATSSAPFLHLKSSISKFSDAPRDLLGSFSASEIFYFADFVCYPCPIWLVLRIRKPSFQAFHTLPAPYLAGLKHPKTLISSFSYAPRALSSGFKAS